MEILTIDPGHTTGMAIFNFNDDGIPLTYMPVGYNETYKYLSAFIVEEKPDLVVCEKFTITAATAKKTRGGSNEAIELIGVARYLAWTQGITFEEQTPADAKNFCSDAKLRKLGWYVTGLDHTRDALRHLLLAAVRHNVIDLATLIH